jgi:flavin reductase (DIM6/NTAB) family NADH-FMN oxidoreductase RutF
MRIDVASLSVKDAYALLTTVVVPRPIGWITTVDSGGDGHVNLAPFSYFNALCSDPPMVTLSIVDGRGGVPKDTLRLMQATGLFCVNLVEEHDLERMNQTSAELPPQESEAVHFGIETVPFEGGVRVASARVAMACRVVEQHRYGRAAKVTLVIGEVLAFHVEDCLLTGDSRSGGGVAVDGALLSPVSRLDGPHYGLGARRVTLHRPTGRSGS